jgi:hypothetical protein
MMDIGAPCSFAAGVRPEPRQVFPDQKNRHAMGDETGWCASTHADGTDKLSRARWAASPKKHRGNRS